MTRWVAPAAQTIVRGALLFGLWMVLVDNAEWPEVVVGLGAAALAAVYGTFVMSRRRERLRLSAAMVRRAHRPLVLLVSDTVLVTVALAKALFLRRFPTGRFRAVRYGATGQSSEDVTRRILTEWATGVAANRYAVGVDVERGYLLVHQLVESGGPLDPLELG
jgi:hypothetical protein